MKEFLFNIWFAWSLLFSIWFVVFAATHAYHFAKFINIERHIKKMREDEQDELQQD